MRILKVIIAFIIIFAPVMAHADLILNVSPMEGGNDLRFGRVDSSMTINKEVRIRILSTGHSQYQLFQRLVQPLTNENGEMMDRNVIVSSSLLGSNGSGTLHLQGAERLGYSDQLVYTSSRGGESDSFSLIYEINSEEIRSSGKFLGQIFYTLRAIDSNERDDFSLNISLDASADMLVEAETESGDNRIILQYDPKFPQEEFIKFNFSGNSFEPVKVTQEVLQIPMDALSHELDLWAIDQAVVVNGQISKDKSPVFAGPRVVFDRSEYPDSLVIQYSFNEKLNEEKAGTYTGKLRYLIESGDYEQVFDVDLNVEISPVFNMEIKYPEGGMVFSKVIPTMAPQYLELEVLVHTNLNKPYFISQDTNGPLTNENGDRFNMKYFKVKEEMKKGSKGKVQHEEFENFSSSDEELFFSDDEGSPANFKVIYELTPHFRMEPGKYSASFVFSLGEI